MRNHRTRSYASLTVALGLTGAVTGCSAGAEQLPAFESLEATYQAVDEVVDCSQHAPEPAVKFPGSGKDTGESVMCTSTVEVLWFDSDEARQDVYELLADTAGEDNPVSFVEGRNWFVVDGTEVMAGAVPEQRVDMAHLAEALGARYTVEQ